MGAQGKSAAEVVMRFAKRTRRGDGFVVYCKPAGVSRDDGSWGKVIYPADVADDVAAAMTEACGGPRYSYVCPHSHRKAHVHLTHWPPSAGGGD